MISTPETEETNRRETGVRRTASFYFLMFFTIVFITASVLAFCDTTASILEMINLRKHRTEGIFPRSHGRARGSLSNPIQHLHLKKRDVPRRMIIKFSLM